jgi:hypothetical protein
MPMEMRGEFWIGERCVAMGKDSRLDLASIGLCSSLETTGCPPLFSRLISPERFVVSWMEIGPDTRWGSA